ncbi:MAG: SusC/RagA family TonB-linked outer membrane protein [Gemmatimonadota bacterium]
MKLWGKCVPILAGAALVFAAHAAPAAAQATGTITGTVVDATSGRTLESAQVFIPALNMGGLTNQQGRFLILNVPVGTHQLRVELIGYTPAEETVTVSAGQTTTVELRVNSTALKLQELVVTGVAGETPRVKLPFTVEKVDVADMPVPSPSADGLIQGKMAGVKVVRGSGKPGDEASIMLRGPTTITGSQAPLIIVDGVITDNTLADIEALDVESVEVVKGAAASSLYGSRAANGVVQIQTKRGSGLSVDQSRVTVRNEYGSQDLEGRIGLSNAHPYKINASGSAYVACDGTEFSWDQIGQGVTVCLDGFDGSQDPARTFQDNPYIGPTYDQLSVLFNGGNFYSNYVAVEGRSGSSNYRASFTNDREEGILTGNDGFKRRNFRLNIDHQVWDNLDISLNTYYAQSIQDEVGSGPFFSATFLPPNVDLTALDEDGTLRIAADPLSLEENPLYEIENRQTTDKRDRFMGSAFVRYSPASWFDVEGNFSIDRYDFNRTDLYPKGYKQLEADPLGGSLFKNDALSNDINASLTASINYAFGDLTTRTKLRYLLEDQHTETFSAEGQDFAVADVPSLGNLQNGKNVNSSIQDITAEGYFFITAFDYQGKYVGDVMVRRDGSSLFGPEERWQTYYRASGAWRIAQEDFWPFDAIDEFKIRYSYGTAGDRPRFSAQYETYSVSQGQILPVTLGNKKLKPAFAQEQEFGLDLVFLSRYSLSLAYADTKVTDQILQVPLPGFAGFQSQWRNAGTLESTAFEASLEASLIESADMSWSARVNFDRIRQTITKLDVPPYRSSFFWIREGEPLGAFYGHRFASSCNDLPSGVDCSQFQVNDDGYLVFVGAGNSYTDGLSKQLWGTSGESGGNSYDWGMPFYAVDADGNNFLPLGNTTPDFTLSWSSNFRYKNLSLYALFDMEQGADIYNQTAQWALREWRGEMADQTGKPDELKKPVAYYSVLYDVNDFSSAFVEDGSYLKLRELSLRYTFDSDQLARFFGGSTLGLESATLNLIGRNLKTWTDFTGYDPEVGQASGGSDAIGRIDNYSYPNFRTITASLELIF